MNIKSVTRLIAALVGTAVLGQPVFASGTASRLPADAAGNDETVSADDGSIIDLNPLRNTVSTDAGYDSVTSVQLDTSLGLIRGYAEYDLAADQTYANVEEAGGSAAGGGFSLETFLEGPGDPGAPDTVNVTIEMDIDGSFFINNGAPTLQLSTDIAVTTLSTGLPLTGNIYQSAFIFSSTALNDASDPVTTLLTSVESPLFGGDTIDYDGGSVDIFSEVLSSLSATLRLTVPVTVGDSFLLSGFVFGIAGPQPDPDDDDLSDGIDVVAAAGGVDFSNTAQLRILLPAGYSFGGSDPLLDNIVLTSPVPVPAAIWLFGGGLAVVFGFGKGRSRRV